MKEGRKTARAAGRQTDRRETLVCTESSKLFRTHEIKDVGAELPAKKSATQDVSDKTHRPLYLSIHSTPPLATAPLQGKTSPEVITFRGVAGLTYPRPWCPTCSERS